MQTTSNCKYSNNKAKLLIFYADKLKVMGNSKNLYILNFGTLLKSRKFDAREIYVFYSTVHDKLAT